MSPTDRVGSGTAGLRSGRAVLDTSDGMADIGRRINEARVVLSPTCYCPRILLSRPAPCQPCLVTGIGLIKQVQGI